MMIRKSTISDLEAIAKLYDKIHMAEENGLQTIGWVRNVYPTRKTAEDSIRRGDMFVLEDGGILGSAIINQIQVDAYEGAGWEYETDKVCVLHTLVIDPGAAGKGYGRSFVEFYEQWALEHGLPEFRLDTNARNMVARAMYKKLGYTQIGIVPTVFNGIEDVDLVLLEKNLDHGGKEREMTLYDGRPENVADRLPREVRTYDFLDSLHIPYQRTDHERADNMEACNEIDAVLGVIICKNLFLCNRQKTKYYLLMMPGDKKFKTKELSQQINSARLSFAEPDAMLKYLDIEPGAVSIMGLMNDRDRVVQLLIDEDVLRDEYIGCHPCVCTSSLKIRTEDVIKKFLPATDHEYMTVHLVGED